MSSFRKYKLVKSTKKSKKARLRLWFFTLPIFLLFFLFVFWLAFNDKKDIFVSENLKQVKVDFSISGPEKIRIGEEVQFLVKINNQEDRALENVEIRIETPPGFLISEATLMYGRRIEKGYLWSIERINQGETKEVAFIAQDFSPPQDQQVLVGSLSFNLAEFNPLFEKKFSFYYVSEPSVSLSVLLPEEISLGQELRAVISLKNLTERAISFLNVIGPEGLIFETDQAVWQIDKLLPQEEKKRIGQMIFHERLGLTNLEFQIKIEINEQIFPLAQLQRQITVTKPNISLNIKINNQEADGAIVDWGEVISVNILYQNKSDLDLKDFKIKVENQEPKVIDFAKTKIPDLFELGDLRARSEGQVGFNLFLKNHLVSASERIKEGRIVFRVSADCLLSEAENQERLDLAKTEASIKIRTQTKLITEARYYSDDYQPFPIGEGPLPFRVGEETKIWLFFRFRNTSNPLNDLTVRTILDPKIRWLNIQEASWGNISFNEETRELVWQIDRLDPYQGGAYSLLEAKVKIAVVPEPIDLGQVIPFTSKISYGFEDGFTLERTRGENEQLNSRLSDALIKWQGEIR